VKRGWLVLLVALWAGACSPSHPRVPYEVTVEGYNERFDSKAGTLTRGFRGTPSTARVELTRAERDTLWDLLAKSGFFEAPSRVGKGPSSGMMPTTTPIRIEVVVGPTMHTVFWNPTVPELSVRKVRGKARALDPQEKGLLEFARKLIEMEERRETVRAMPRLLHF